MQEYTKEQLLTKFNSLPQELKQAIAGVKTSEIIQNISKKHHLQIDQMGELAAETGLVLLGLTKPEDYIKNLNNRLKINLKDARDIALEVNIEIFSKVKESLKKLHGIGVSPVVNMPSETVVEKTPVQILESDKKTKVAEEILENFNIRKENLEYQVIPNPSEKIELKKTAPENPPVPEPFKKTTPEFPPLPPYSQKTAENENTAEKTEINKTADRQKEPMERFVKQTTEINLEKENKETKITTGKYPSGDPYKEPV